MIPGASAQVFAGGFAKAAEIEVRYVPFKGDADGALALAGGHIDAHVAVPVSYKSLVEAKKVRILAIAADKPSSLYRGIPTFRENGVGLVIGSFHAVFAPKGTPVDVIGILEAALEKTMKENEVNDQMTKAGLGLVYLNRRDGTSFIAQQDATYRALIQDLGMMVSPKK
jgi:tripartite-type tricarboxylate transporter receptor subunit TctC